LLLHVPCLVQLLHSSMSYCVAPCSMYYCINLSFMSCCVAPLFFVILCCFTVPGIIALISLSCLVVLLHCFLLHVPCLVQLLYCSMSYCVALHFHVLLGCSMSNELFSYLTVLLHVPHVLLHHLLFLVLLCCFKELSMFCPDAELFNVIILCSRYCCLAAMFLVLL
jgi:hypothetical protein